MLDWWIMVGLKRHLNAEHLEYEGIFSCFILYKNSKENNSIIFVWNRSADVLKLGHKSVGRSPNPFSLAAHCPLGFISHCLADVRLEVFFVYILLPLLHVLSCQCILSLWSTRHAFYTPQLPCSFAMFCVDLLALGLPNKTQNSPLNCNFKWVVEE